MSLYLLVRYEHDVQDAINILWTAYLFLPWNFNCLFTSRSLIILLFQVTSLKESFFFLLKYKSTVSHSPIEWAYYMLLVLESQICVVIVLQKEFNRTMTWRRSTELSCLCVKPVWGTKSQYRILKRNPIKNWQSMNLMLHNCF